MIYSILLVTELLLSISLIVLILLQHGKGADAGAAFGSGASGTVFGARGAGNFLSRTTAILATLFFINCLALAFVVSKSTNSDVGQSVIGDVPAVEAPAVLQVPEVPAPADIPAGNSAVDQGGARPSDVPNQ